MIIKFPVILILICSVTKDVLGQCIVYIDDLPKIEEPIYIRSGKLHNPEKITVGRNIVGALKWTTGRIGRVICSGGSKIKELEISDIKFKCERNNKLIDTTTQQEINLKDISCTKNITANIRRTEEICHYGKIIEIGFQYENDFYKYFDVCYNDNRGSVKYTKHKIAGRGRKPTNKKGSITTSDDTFVRSTFSKDGLPFYSREGQPYTKANQVNRFSNIIQNSDLTLPAFDTVHQFLAAGHLTPVADGFFNNFKRATMFYINTAPEWQAINAGNWQRVENIARCMAYTLNDDLEVITGIAEVLTMPNNLIQKYEELYLTTTEIQQAIINRRSSGKNKVPRIDIPKETEENLIPVPKYYWKVLKYKNESIAFVTLNNPYTKEDDNTTIPCTDICREYGYSTDDSKEKGFHNFNGGRTYCCKVNELVDKFVYDVPPDLKQNPDNVLSYKENTVAGSC